MARKKGLITLTLDQDAVIDIVSNWLHSDGPALLEDRQVTEIETKDRYGSVSLVVTLSHDPDFDEVPPAPAPRPEPL